jgi:Tfp pilus assembly protein PilF
MPTAPPLRTPPAGVRPVRLPTSLTAVACLLATLVVATVTLVGWCAPAHAQANKDDLASTVAKLNKKALDEYENLNFEEARKILKDALDFCHEAGLDQHPVTARTNIHLGVVVLTGFKQRDAATKYFRKAIEIQPDIKMTKSLANPEIQAAFDEVVASMKGSSQVTPPPIKSGAESGISHEPVTRGPQGQSIPITVTIDPSLTPDKVLLWFRTGLSGDFTSRDMTEATPGNFAAELPPTATGGSQVSYFIEAQKGGQPVATLGSQASPFPVALSAPSPPMGVQRPRPRPVSPRASDGSPSFYLGLSVGSGVGWASGAGEINTMHTTDPAGFAPAQAVHLSPEIGYFLSPDLLLSVQARIQFLSGLTSMTCATTCASPPSTAIAAFARLTWFLSTASLKPYLSASVGGGRIRHVAEFPKFTDCGTGTTTCVESIPAGAVLLGPGAGIVYSLTRGFGLVAGLNTQLGFPRFTFNVDLNVGVAATF